MVEHNERQSDRTQAKKRALLLGLGFDHEQGEKRITRGKNFILAGGSKRTHEFMQDKAVRFNEELDRRRKKLEDIGPEEFRDIAERIKLHEGP